MPFGVAYATAGSLFGFLGVFAGHLVSGRDTLRILTSCFMARIFRMTLPSFIEENRPLSYFLFTLWGTMLGGLAGFFFSEYTPKENMAFMLNGLLSGGLAWLFSMAASAFSPRPLGNTALRYVCCLLSLSAVLLGLMSYGGLWETAGRTALIFLILCVGFKCSFFYTLSTAAVTGLVLCLFSPSRIYFFLMIVVGTLLSAALKSFGKYGQIFSYLLSSLVLWLCTERSFGLFSSLISIALAGLLFLMVPVRLMSLLTKATVPVGGGYGKWKKARFRLTKQGNTQRLRGEESVCRTCPKRILCLTKFRTETAQAFDEIRTGVRNHDLRPPREFLDRCVRFPEVIAALRSDEETAFGLHYAKAFAQKEGELFCGDTAGGFRTADDRFVFTITDGMGSGTKAARQSVKAVRVMENLSKNGLEQADILKVLNRSLLDSAEESVLGVDVATVDLKSGVCDLFKAGAAPTYILRNGIVYEIGSETLPIGMLDEADIKHERCTLADKDYLVLISDGVLGKDKKWLSEYLNRAPAPRDCVTLADGILKEAKKSGRNRIDDVTVLAVQINKVA
ncbi:MAG: SpoIIE family protein phosphatase [Clostridia bacterium]|nr:SpoIIE family protein phosphatase [Clostridia bacterium]